MMHLEKYEGQFTIEEMKFLTHFGKFMLKEMPKEVKNILLAADKRGMKYQIEMIFEEVIKSFQDHNKFLLNIDRWKEEMMIDYLVDYIYERAQ